MFPKKPHIVLIVFFLLSASALFGQLDNYATIDRYAVKTPSHLTSDVVSLSQYLAASSDNDRDKIRAFYTWIKEHIKYDRNSNKEGNFSYNHSPNTVLQKRKAVCTGYANLFKALCDVQKIPSDIVEGYTKTSFEAIRAPAVPDHVWNTVYLDSSWYLLDVTWAAGQSHSGKPQSRYFMVDPSVMIQDHLPSMPMWQLIDQIVTMDQFIRSKPSNEAKKAIFHHRDSIAVFRMWPKRVQRVKMAEAVFRFHPSPGNRRELGHTYLDYAGILVDSSEHIADTDTTGHLMQLHKEIITLCSKAEKMVTFHTWQSEMFAHTLINFTTSQFNSCENLKGQSPDYFKTLLAQLSQADDILIKTESTMFVQAALKQSHYLREVISAYLE